MNDWWEGVEAEGIPADRPRELAYFVGGPADGDRREVPLCRHMARSDVSLHMPDGTFAFYDWSVGDQLYRFAGIVYPHD